MDTGKAGGRGGGGCGAGGGRESGGRLCGGGRRRAATRATSRRAPATSGRFFFSSRRRHTRFDCDWSSDVCSSDLAHDLGHRVLRGNREEHVHVIRHQVPLFNATFLLFGQRAKDFSQMAPQFVVERDRKSVV